MARKVYTLGKVAYSARARRNLCELEWELRTLADGRLEFSGTGTIWDANHNDHVSGGQNIEEVCALFPHDPFAQRFLEVWRAWHLNGMNAGTPAQTAALEPVRETFDRMRWFDEARAYLESVGLQPDPAGADGTGETPYWYGSAWLYRELPAELVAEIRAWPVVREVAR